MLIKKETKNLELSSLGARMIEISKFKDKVFLIDMSGSMTTWVEEGTKVDIVRSIIRELPPVNLFRFDTYCSEVLSNSLGEPSGSTNMAGAFNKMHSRGFKKITLLTDGHPDSEEKTLEAAKGLEIKTIYIGPAPVPEFLNKLGGLISIDMLQIGATKELKKNVIRLLTE
jgi:hypothetical protein